MKKQSVINYINTHSLTGIKAGLNRPSFLDIWMVVVDDRIFARSWGLAEKSWYNSFMESPVGQIKCGEMEVSIHAQIPEDLSELTEKINHAYLSKYNSEHSREYAIGIVQEKHLNKTMEFIIIEE